MTEMQNPRPVSPTPALPIVVDKPAAVIEKSPRPSVVGLLDKIGWYNASLRLRIILIASTFLLLQTGSSTLFGLSLFWNDRRAYLFENHLLKSKLVYAGLKNVILEGASPEPFAPESSEPNDLQNRYAIPRLPMKKEIFAGKDQSGTIIIWRDAGGNLFRSKFTYKSEMCPPDSGLCYLVAANGIFLGSSNPALVSENSFKERQLFLDSIKGGFKNGFRFISVENSKQDVAVTYNEVDGTNIFVFIETSTSGLLEAAQTFVTQMFTVSALFFILAIILLGRALLSILSPLTQMQSSFESIAKGKFNVSIDYEFNDEFLTLMNGAKAMSAELSKRESLLNGLRGNLIEVLQFTNELNHSQGIEECLSRACFGIAKNLNSEGDCFVAVLPDKITSEKLNWSGLQFLESNSKTSSSAGTLAALLKMSNTDFVKNAREPLFRDSTLIIPVYNRTKEKLLTLLLLFEGQQVNPTFENRHFITTMTGSLSGLLENFIQKIDLDKAFEVSLEMSLSASIQKSLLTDTLAVKGLHLESTFRPASQVGGDWFSIHADPKNSCVYIALGDATGHGLSAAMVSLVCCEVFKSVLTTLTKETNVGLTEMEGILTEALNVLNKSVKDTAKGRILSSCVGLAINNNTGKGVLISAGHCFPFLRKRGTEKSQPVRISGDLLGIMDGPIFGCQEITLKEGETLLMFSDGLYENTGFSNERMSKQRIYEKFEQRGQDEFFSMDKFMNSMDDFWKGKQGEDDVLVLALTRTGDQ